MRATEKNRPRGAWRRFVAITAAALLALSTFGSGMALAAPPNWSMDPVVSLPAAVTPGDAAGYLVTINNAGPSSISQLYLIAYLDSTTSAAPNPVFTSQTQGNCPNTGGTLYCSLGPLRAGRSVSVTAAFTTPSGATSFSIRFEANTTGATVRDGGTSHGDTIVQLGSTILTNDPNFAGRFVTSGLQTVGNTQALSSTNPQTTQVGAPALGIGVTVADGTPASAWCLTCSSESSEVHVNSGAAYPNGFRIDIQLLKGLVNGSISTVYHQLDDETIETIEITNTCPKTGTPNSSQLPCFSTKKLGGGNILVTIWTAVNGRFGM